MDPSFPAANATHFCRELSVGVTFLHANSVTRTELSHAFSAARTELSYASCETITHVSCDQAFLGVFWGGGG
jgi:hypothetical protein